MDDVILLKYQGASVERKIKKMTKARVDVLTERKEQITREGFTEAHDDKYEHGTLVQAAICYAETMGPARAVPPNWPWAEEDWKPRAYRKNLVRAAALLLAEIERLDRMK